MGAQVLQASPALLPRASERRTRAACRRGLARGTPPRASGRPRGEETERRRHRAPRAPPRSGPERSSSSEPSGSGPWPNASRRGCRDDRDVARVEPRIVPAHRPHADRNGIRLRTQDVHEASRVVSRHPPGTRHGHAAVERDRDLVRHERSPKRDPRPPLLDLLAATERDLALGELDFDSGLTESLEPARVLVLRLDLSSNHTSDARFDESVCTRRSGAVVRAGLERDVDGGAASSLAGCLEGHDLGVRTALALVPAFADHVVAHDDDRAHDRVRVRRAPPSLCELDRTLQELRFHHSDPTVEPTHVRCARRPQ